MPEPYSIHIKNVSKVYKLHGSHRDQLIEVLGLKRLGFKPKIAAKEFVALSDISLAVPRGHRIGIVGRNGAGKTTLLKLICGNFSPTQGDIEINGAVQALMHVGLGFHPEYTGRENVEASLQYSGLEHEDYQQAIDEIIEFCELGDFLDQPFKTYSLGMQARLMFAAATAIRPDILIVDEVLGAGDAYFVAKSKARVMKLVESGCTMLLVSHSMQQVLELCDEAIWLDQGRIRMQGDAFSVVKAYEEYLHGPIDQLGISLPQPEPANPSEAAQRSEVAAVAGDRLSAHLDAENRNIQLQTPRFLPHSLNSQFAVDVPSNEMHFVARGGISRWQSERGLKICGFSIATDRGISNELVSLTPAKVILHLVAEYSGHFNCRYGIVISDSHGRNVSVIYSPIDDFEIKEGQTRKLVMGLNPIQLGPGHYTLGISVLEGSPLEYVNQAKRYDLLGRSFEFTITLPDTLGALQGAFLHTAEWEFLV